MASIVPALRAAVRVVIVPLWKMVLLSALGSSLKWSRAMATAA